PQVRHPESRTAAGAGRPPVAGRPRRLRSLHPRARPEGGVNAVPGGRRMAALDVTALVYHTHTGATVLRYPGEAYTAADAATFDTLPGGSFGRGGGLGSFGRPRFFPRGQGPRAPARARGGRAPRRPPGPGGVGPGGGQRPPPLRPRRGRRGSMWS